jgi:hypothetical protein
MNAQWKRQTIVVEAYTSIRIIMAFLTHSNRHQEDMGQHIGPKDQQRLDQK